MRISHWRETSLGRQHLMDGKLGGVVDFRCRRSSAAVHGRTCWAWSPGESSGCQVAGLGLAAGLFEVSEVKDRRPNTASSKPNHGPLATLLDVSLELDAIKAACECRHCACYQLGGGCCYCERKIERCVWESLEHELRDQKVR